MKSERGFTLLETVLAIALIGFLVGVLGMAVQQVVTTPEKANDQVDALHSVQAAAHWVAMDGQMAMSAVGGSSLVITLPDSRTISYALTGTELFRTDDDASRMVAQNVASVNFTVAGKTIYMTIVAAPSSRWDISENQTYRIFMRTSG
jgi:prepilin-type N-terminal cleavage/methylation domain-containing protein